MIAWPANLTHLVWKNIELAMIVFMEGVKAERLERLRLDIIKSRRELFRKYLESSVLFARTPVVEASQLEDIRDLIENSPTDYELQEKSFEPFKSSLVAFSSTWAASKESVLLRLVQVSFAVPYTPNVSVLKLATTFFHHMESDEPIPASDVLIHPILFCRSLWDPLGPESQERLFTDFKQVTWNFNHRLSFHKPAFQAAQSVLLSCVPSINPVITTAEEMDRWDPLLECASCYSSLQGRLVMTWRRAVRLVFSSSPYPCAQADLRYIKVVHALSPVHNNLTPPRWKFVHVVDSSYAKASCEILAAAPQYRCFLCCVVGDHASFGTHMASRSAEFDN